jgi:hypothetical protein
LIIYYHALSYFGENLLGNKRPGAYGNGLSSKVAGITRATLADSSNAPG